MEDKNMRYPSIEVLFPPVDISNDMKNIIKIVDKRIKIIQLGRVFSGRQNKGHKQVRTTMTM
jgi:hypothetical protein